MRREGKAKKSGVDFRACERCGAKISIGEKCFIRTLQNKEHPVHILTSRDGHQYMVRKPTSALTRISIGLCPSCVQQAEELLLKFKEEIV